MRAELEYSIIAAICLEPSLVKKLQVLCSVDDFSIPACGQAFDCVCSAVARGKAIDANIVADDLRNTVENPRQFIADCLEITPSIANAEEWAKMLHAEAREERFKSGVQSALESENSVVEIAELCKAYLTDATGNRLKTASAATASAISALSKKNQHRIDFGFPILDGLLKGGEAGQLILIGARPSVGKSAFLLNIAAHVASAGNAVLFVTLEMLAEEQIERLISMRSGVELDKLIDKKLSEADWNGIAAASNEIDRLPLHFYDKPACTPRKIIETATTVPDLKLIVVDYIGLMSSDKKFDSRNLELGAISRDLKNTAQELKVPIIAAAQLNRAVEDIDRPTLASLRDSGELEQNGSKVIFLWNVNADTHTVGVSVAKNRRGKIGIVQFCFDGAHQKFTELSAPYVEPPRKKQGFL